METRRGLLHRDPGPLLFCYSLGRLVLCILPPWWLSWVEGVKAVWGARGL